jgi:hypothetical protein
MALLLSAALVLVFELVLVAEGRGCTPCSYLASGCGRGEGYQRFDGWGGERCGYCR